MLAAITKTLLDINYQRTFIDRAVRTTYYMANCKVNSPEHLENEDFF